MSVLSLRRLKPVLRPAGLLALAILAGGTNPAEAAFVYVTNNTGNTINVVDTATNTVVAQPDVGATSQYAAGVLPNGNFAYIGTSANQLKVLDTRTHAVVATITVGTSPRSVVALPDSSRLYVVNGASSNVSVIDTATNTVTATIPVGGSPFDATTIPDGTRVFVVNNTDDSVSVIDTASNTVISTIGTGSSPVGLVSSPDGSKVYVSHNANPLGVIDTAGLTYSTLVNTLPPTGRGISVSPDGTRLYLSLFNNDMLRVLDASAGTTVTDIAVGDGPTGTAINAAGTRVYVTNATSGSVSVIDTTNNTVATTIGATPGSYSLSKFVTPELSLLTVADTLGGRVNAGTAAGPQLACTGTCQRNYATTATVTLTASAATPSTRFWVWSGDCSGTSSSVTVSMAAARNCTANFIDVPSPPPPPPSWVNPGVPPQTVTAVVGSNGQFVSTSLAAIFQNPAALTFTATLANGTPLPAGITFDGPSQTFSGTAQLPAPPLQPVGTSPNGIFPPAVQTADLSITLTARDAQGASYSIPLSLALNSPRPLAAIAALSAATGGSGGNAASGRPALSHDGGQVVFQSAATNLVTTAAPAGTDILRYRALSGSLDRLSQSAFPTGGPTGGALGPAIDPTVSSDGRYAAFAATGQGFVLGLNANGVRQIYRIGLNYPRVDRDPATPVAELVSATASGLAGNAHSDTPVLSGDGRYAVFASRATNLGPGLDGTSRIWRKDMQTGALILVSPPGDATDPAVTADGRFVAFAAGGQIHLKDLGNGALWTVAQGTRPRLSASGEAIVFVSGSSIVVVRGGATTTVGAGDQPSVSADGRFIAWRTPTGQVQVSDTLRGVSALVSKTAAGQPGNATSSDPAMSGDGRSIAFATNATDLVNGTLTAGQVVLAGNPLVDPAGTRYWYLTSGDQQSLAIERQGNRAYVASLTYDTSGSAIWYAGFCSFSGLTCSGQFNYVTGGSTIADQRASAAPGAGFAIAFAENGTDASLTLNAASLAMKAFPLGGTTAPALPGLPEAGWWYNTDDPSGATGWFLATATPNTNGVPGTPVAMLTGTVYDRAGQPFWAVAQGTIAGSTSFSFGATLNRYAGGAPLGQTATRSPSASPLGPIAVTWTGPRTATVILPDGRRANLAKWQF